MSSPHRQLRTILLPLNLGPASGFDRTFFPLLSFKRNFGHSEYYLDATLDEILKVQHITSGVDPKERQAFVDAVKARYDQLVSEKEELENRSKSWKKWLENYRAVRLFLDSSKSLYNQTKSRSDDMARTERRALVSVPAEEVQPVEDDPPLDTEIMGIAVGFLDDTASQQLRDAVNSTVPYSGPTLEGDEAASEMNSILSREYFLASESLISLSTTVVAEEETPDVPTPPIPSSSTIINNISYNGCIFPAHSPIIGPTIQFGGHDNSGSVNHNINTASDMSPRSP